MGGLFDDSEFVVPLVPAPRARKGAARGAMLDARFANDYPASWHRCGPCGGTGWTWGDLRAGEPPSDIAGDVEYVWTINLQRGGVGEVELVSRERHPHGEAGDYKGFRRRDVVCSECLGMGSLKARVRLEAGHRCVRCKHPYVPKGDAAMLGVEPSGMREVAVEDRLLNDLSKAEGEVGHSRLQGHLEKVWTPWSACDEQCTHGGSLRIVEPDYVHDLSAEQMTLPREMLRVGLSADAYFEAEWRILTVHHLDGDKANCRWWNLVALCQVCHLEIQAKVVMERVYPWEHSEWFKPYVAGYYAAVYLGEDLSRQEVEARLDELLDLERAA